MSQEKWWQIYKKLHFECCSNVKRHIQSPVLISDGWRSKSNCNWGYTMCKLFVSPRDTQWLQRKRISDNTARKSHAGGAFFIWQLQEQILINDPIACLETFRNLFYAVSLIDWERVTSITPPFNEGLRDQRLSAQMVTARWRPAKRDDVVVPEQQLNRANMRWHCCLLLCGEGCMWWPSVQKCTIYHLQNTRIQACGQEVNTISVLKSDVHIVLIGNKVK